MSTSPQTSLPSNARTFAPKYLEDTLQNLSDCVQFLQPHRPTAYRLAAVLLRLLVCDQRRIHNRTQNTALIPRVHPGFTLFTGHPQRSLPLPAWLDQYVELSEDLVISRRDLIKLVCEKDGGAHVDLDQNPLARSSSLQQIAGESIWEMAREILNAYSRLNGANDDNSIG